MAATILVADDDEFIRLYLKKRLSGQGYSVLSAVDGEEAFALAQEHLPDVIVSDWMMPKMDGIEFCHKIKADARLRFTYFIFLTARDKQDDKISSMDEGADDYLAKPFQDKELLARINVGVRITALQKELMSYQHQRAITELAVTIGHEINNPLGIMMLTLQVMKKRFNADNHAEFPKDVETCLTNGRRVAEIVKKLCSLSDPHFKPYLKDSSVDMIDL
ncbi:MAG TPA: response regulator [Bacteroidota bacterium]|nr:response regulator [Bacteroidota bacterium]